MPVENPSPARNADYSAGTAVPTLTTVYALGSTGGFTAERRFEDISLNEQTAPIRVDVTGAVQIKFSASTLNDRLGEFITASDTYTNDSVTISCEDISGILVGDILTVGALSTLNSDFGTFISGYFGIAGGFESLYAEETSMTTISNEIFNAAAFKALISSDTSNNITHAGIKVLTGSITVSNVSKLIRYIVDGNVFNNRDPSGNDWGLVDKFQAGDLIWCASGITVTLNLGLNAENMLPVNTLAFSGAGSGGTSPFNWTASGAVGDLLSRTSHAPILFILV